MRGSYKGEYCADVQVLCVGKCKESASSVMKGSYHHVYNYCSALRRHWFPWLLEVPPACLSRWLLPGKNSVLHVLCNDHPNAQHLLLLKLGPHLGVSNSGFLLLSSGSGLASMPKRERVTPGHVRGLNTLLGNNEFCRKRLLKEGSLLKWPSPKLTGIISMKALRLNRAVMRRVAEILCPQDQHPLSIRVPGIKQEAGQ